MTEENQDQYDSDTDYSVFVTNPGGRQGFIPQWIWDSLPKISRQDTRAWTLEQERLVPNSFAGVISEFGQWYGGGGLFFSAIQLTISEFILSHITAFLAVVLMFVGGYILYQLTVIQNNPKIAEEVILFTAIRAIALLIAFYVLSSK